MTPGRRRAGGALLALLALTRAAAGGPEDAARPAAACIAPAPEILFAACAPRIEILLLPEDAARVGARLEAGALTVTGAYTGADTRGEALPKPVGVFIHRGTRVSLELARMDGLLIVDARGAATIAAVRAAPLDGLRHDLRSLKGRLAFAAQAHRLGVSALQSHLLINDGALDLRPVADAPRARRRLLFQTADGAMGVWDSGARLLTLHDAAAALLESHAPRMALNLDMGSFDFCEATGEMGLVARCGTLSRAAVARLSNLIRLRPQ